MARWQKLCLLSLVVVQFSGAVVTGDEETKQKSAPEDKQEEASFDHKVLDGFRVEDRATMWKLRLMDIIINSIYTDKHVFWRELIPNVADALETARFHKLQDESYLWEPKD